MRPVAPRLLEDGTSGPLPTCAFADTVLSNARAADGRWVAFNWADRVRDVGGRFYALDGADRTTAHRELLTALIESDACPEVTDTFRRWRDGP